MAETPVDEFAPTQRLATLSGAAPSDPDQLAPGTLVARYRIDALLGRGGMGEVYRAEQLEPVRRTVALKLLHRHRIDARQLGYFEIERQILARMQHPAIAQIFDAGTTPEGAPWFAMEWIQGLPLTRYCDERGLDLRARLELFVRVCEGVQHAHQKGVIHRDLKPQNILVLDVDGRPLPKIIDFGIATAASRTAAAAGEVAGTPAYMSPEQAGHAPYEVDIRSDVYSLGVVLYELLSGHRPEAASGEAESQRTLRKPPSRALETLPDAEVAELAQHLGLSRARLRQHLRRDLDWIVMQAIRPDRDERYASAAAFADDLRRYLEDRPVRAAPGGRLYAARKFVRRHRLGIAAGSVALAALLAGLGVSLYGLWQAEAQRRLAEARSRELEQVAAFQQSMLEGIDVEAMGRGLLEAQRAQVAAAAQRPGVDPQALAGYDALVAQTAPADLARGVLDRHVLARALDTLDRDFATQPRLDADLREAVAGVYQAIGAYARAAELLPAVVAARSRELGPDDPATIRAELELGTALNRSGRLPEARALQESLRTRAARLPALAEDLREKIEVDYALTLSDQGELGPAIEVQQALLDRILAARGERDAAALKVRNNLAISMMRVGRRDEGRAQFEAVLKARRETLGAEHEDTVASMGNVAAARGMSGDVEGALALQEEVYAIRRRQLGEDHPLTLGDRGNLGSTLNSLGRFEEAREHLAASLEGRRRVLGPDHPQTLRSILNLGSVLSRLGRHEEALALQRQAFEARRASLGAEHPDTLNSAMNVATTLRDAGRPQEGLALARETLAARERVLGPLHPDTVGSSHALASVASAAGDRALAKRTLEAALAKPELPERLALATAARLYALLRDSGDTAAAQRLREERLDAFLQRDPATLPGPERSLRTELLREMGESPGP
jgi:tetratricopeptide (TPR) repeat protein